jgi:small subunit ribosomal protein S9
MINKKTKIEDLDLPTKTTNLLLGEGIKTVAGLIEKEEKELLDIDGMGPGRLKKIKKSLGDDFNLKEDEKQKKDEKEIKKEEKEVVKKKEKKKNQKNIKNKNFKKGGYYEAEGKRKTAIARVRIWPKEKGFIVNKKSLKDYFPTDFLRKVAEDSLREIGLDGKVKVSVIARGGGISAQAEAVRHGIARALVLYNPEFRNKLKKAGYLTRDSRMKERKKFGLKGARKSPQWSKR